MEKIFKNFNDHMSFGNEASAAQILSSKWRASGRPTQKKIEAFIQEKNLGGMFMFTNGCLVAA